MIRPVPSKFLMMYKWTFSRRKSWVASFTSSIRPTLNTISTPRKSVINKQPWTCTVRSRQQIPLQIRVRSFPKWSHRYATSVTNKIAHRILRSPKQLIMSENLQKMTFATEDPIQIWMEAPSSVKAVHLCVWISPKTLFLIQITCAAIWLQSNLQRMPQKRKKKFMSC